MMEYRAAYFVADNGQETVLTGPEHASLDDEALIKAALEEAINASIVDVDEQDPQKAWPRLTMRQLMAGLKIGLWRE